VKEDVLQVAKDDKGVSTHPEDKVANITSRGVCAAGVSIKRQSIDILDIVTVPILDAKMLTLASTSETF
jgi:hypothetical protein